MRIMKIAISFTLVLSLLLALSVSALAADTGYGQYIKLSKEPLDWVHITGTMPAIAGNPEVPIDDTAYLMPDDATLSISLPSGGTYFEGMSMLDFPAGSGDPGWNQPLVNERLYSDGLYTYRVYTSNGTQLEEFRYITKGYADKLTGLGFTITPAVEEEPSGFADVPADAYYADPVPRSSRFCGGLLGLRSRRTFRASPMWTRNSTTPRRPPGPGRTIWPTATPLPPMIPVPGSWPWSSCGSMSAAPTRPRLLLTTSPPVRSTGPWSRALPTAPAPRRFPPTPPAPGLRL